MTKTYTIEATWDAESATWVAESPDLPGLVTGAASIEALMTKLDRMIPDLLEARGELNEREVPFELVARKMAVAHVY